MPLKSWTLSQTDYSTLKGKITIQNNRPLAYANIFLKGKTDGTISNEQGEFIFKTSANGTQILICSYIGHQLYEKELQIKAGETIELTIFLKQKDFAGEQVMITASAFTAADEEGVTLTAMDVVRTPGAAADLFWAIKSFPGLQQVEDGAGLFVRGGDVSETVILLDGAIINHPYKFESPTGGYFGTFSPFLLKGTFFSSSGFSAQYGNALSGALSMESVDLPNKQSMGVGICLAAESIFLSTPIIKNKFGISLSGNRSNTKMMFELNNNSRAFSKYPFSYDLNLNAVYKIDNQSQLKFFLCRVSDEVGVEVDDADFLAFFNSNTTNELYNLRYKTLIGKKVLISANLAVNSFLRDMQLSVMDLSLDDILYQSRFTIENEFFKGTAIRTGLAFYQYQTFISGTVPQQENDLNPDTTPEIVRTDYRSNRAVQFVELETFLPLGIKMTSGLRSEYESISRQHFFDPRIALIYARGLNSNITASWGIFHQYPQPRFYDPDIGNPDLFAMKARHYIFGYAYQKDNKIFRVEAYYKKYSDLLLEQENLNYANNGHGFVKCIDVFAKNSYGPISGWISYSWLQARRKWMDLPVLTSPYFDITHNVITVLNFDLTSRFSLGSSFRYATGKPYTPALGKYHQSRVPAYAKLDLNFSYLYSFFASNMTVFYFSIANVLNRVNIFDYRYSTDYQRRDVVKSSFNRSVYFGLQFNF